MWIVRELYFALWIAGELCTRCPHLLDKFCTPFLIDLSTRYPHNEDGPTRRGTMNDQPNLPLDERFREAEQYALDLPPPARPQPRTEIEDGACPYHTAFVYECRFCNPR